MKERPAVLTISKITDASVYIEIKFQDTGEIQTKKRSLKWLSDRLYKSERRTWKKYNEDIPFFFALELKDSL